MLRRLIAKEKDFDFVVIYTREPHARQMAFKEIAQPRTWEERKALAEKTKKELELDVLFLIDEMGDPSRKLFGDVPNPAILVERDGTIKDKLAWADASELKKLLETWRPVRTEKREAPDSRPVTPKAGPAEPSPAPVVDPKDGAAKGS